MDVATVELMTASIKLVGRVSSFVHKEQAWRKLSLPNILLAANQHLTKLMDVLPQTSSTDEKQQKRVRDAMQSVRSHVSSLNEELREVQTTDQQAVNQLLSGFIRPLDRSVAVVKSLLDDDDHVVTQICYVLGTSVLVTAYATLGPNEPSLQEDLVNGMQQLQVRILQDVDKKMHEMQRQFPWETIHRLLDPDGSDQLLKLYRSVIDEQKKAKIQEIREGRARADARVQELREAQARQAAEQSNELGQ